MKAHISCVAVHHAVVVPNAAHQATQIHADVEFNDGITLRPFKLLHVLAPKPVMGGTNTIPYAIAVLGIQGFYSIHQHINYSLFRFSLTASD